MLQCTKFCHKFNSFIHFHHQIFNKMRLKSLVIGTCLSAITLSIQAQSPAIVTTVAGSGGYLDAPGVQAQFRNPLPITVHAATGTIYVSDVNNVIRRITPDSVVSSVAGTPFSTTLQNGNPGSFMNVQGLAVHPSGDTLYVADRAGNRDSRIRMVVLSGTNAGTVSTIAGAAGGNPTPTDNAVGISARFEAVGQMIFLDGFLYVLETAGNNRRIRRIATTGTYATQTLTATGFVANYANGVTFNNPTGICAKGNDTLFVSTAGDHAIYQVIISTGAVTQLAGGTSGNADGAATTARFNQPSGLVYVAADSSLYIADRNNHRIRRFNIISNQVTTVAGQAGAFVDGIGTLARFNNPAGLVVNNGNIFITDVSNSRIRGMNLTTRSVGTVAGSLPIVGTAATTPFSSAGQGIMDKNGNMYYLRNHAIVKVLPNFDSFIYAGNDAATGLVDNVVGTQARFNDPSCLAILRDSLLLVGDRGSNNRIRQINLKNDTVSTYLLLPTNITNVVSIVNDGDSVLYIMARNANSGANLGSKVYKHYVGTNTLMFFAGGNSNTHANGDATTARFNFADGNNSVGGGIFNDTLYFTDGRASNPFTVRGIVLQGANKGNVFTLFSSQANQNPVYGVINLNNPDGLVIDKFGTMYVPNFAYGAGIRRFNLVTKNLEPFTATSNTNGFVNGAVANARFSSSSSILLANNAIDMYIFDNGNLVLRKVSPLYINVNLPPTFTTTLNNNTLTVLEDAGLVEVQWATNISANQSPFEAVQAQKVGFVIQNITNPTRFVTLPTIDSTGVLRFQTQPDLNGNNFSSVTVRAFDNGGTANGGVDSSAAVTFNIDVTPVNDAPTFLKGNDINLPSNDTVQKIFSSWATQVYPGADNEQNQAMTFTLTADNPALFTEQPTIQVIGTGLNRSGTLRFKINGTVGTTVVNTVLRDNGGVTNGGVDSSMLQTFNITVTQAPPSSLAQNIELQDNVRIFPNPATEFVMIAWNGSYQQAKIEITDLQGRVLYDVPASGIKEWKVSTRQLSKGVYFIRLVTDEGIATAKLLKQ